MKYEIIPFPKMRVLVAEYVRASKKKNNIELFIEADLTHLLEVEDNYKSNQIDFSLPSYILFCFGHLLNNHIDLISMRNGNRMVKFKEVDVLTIVERQASTGEKIPMSIVIRDIGSKSFKEVLLEIRSAQKNEADKIVEVKNRRRILNYPYWIMRLIMRYIMASPIRYHKHYGNAAFTSPYRAKKARFTMAIPISPCSISLLLNSSFKKIVKENGEFKEKTFIGFTFVVDHDIVDGAAGMRVAEEFCAMVESGYGL
jgi:pyruvate/2-oxoglutarate dehydrogenase complex dihydrolipoamide acyltransferase (E2) component